MAITYKSLGQSLTTTLAEVYVPSDDILCAILLRPSLCNKAATSVGAIAVTVTISGQRNLTIVQNLNVYPGNMPQILPVFSVQPGERVLASASTAGVDLSMTVAEHR